MSNFSVESFLSYSTKKFRTGTVLGYDSENLRGRKSLWIRERERERGGGVSRFTVQTFLSHSAKNSLAEPFCAMFDKIPGSEKVLDKKGGEEYQDFPSKKFCITVPKFFVGTPSCVTIFGYRKMLGINRKKFLAGQ